VNFAASSAVILAFQRGMGRYCVEETTSLLLKTTIRVVTAMLF
jgi:hypothetical protein